MCEALKKFENYNRPKEFQQQIINKWLSYSMLMSEEVLGFFVEINKSSTQP